MADTSAKYTTVTNKGNEATPYLQYIIDNYDNLPETIIFSHGHKRAPLRAATGAAAPASGALPAPLLARSAAQRSAAGKARGLRAKAVCLCAEQRAAPAHAWLLRARWAHRRAWHLEDKIRIIKTLRWGEIGFANLRHANMVCPEVWNCKWLRLDWRWSGNWLHPKDWDNQTVLQVGPADSPANSSQIPRATACALAHTCVCASMHLGVAWTGHLGHRVHRLAADAGNAACTGPRGCSAQLARLSGAGHPRRLLS